MPVCYDRSEIDACPHGEERSLGSISEVRTSHVQPQAGTFRSTRLFPLSVNLLSEAISDPGEDETREFAPAAPAENSPGTHESRCGLLPLRGACRATCRPWMAGRQTEDLESSGEALLGLLVLAAPLISTNPVLGMRVGRNDHPGGQDSYRWKSQKRTSTPLTTSLTK